MTAFRRISWALISALFLTTSCTPGAEEHQVRQASRVAAPPAPQALGLDIRGLPPEAIHVLTLIQHGGPFPSRKDGSEFQNRERRLPNRPRGYYREYTVPTPGEHTRGARRIVTGGKPPVVYYYTPDHYRSFNKIPVLQ